MLPSAPDDMPVQSVYAGKTFPAVGPIHIWKAEDPFALLDDPRYLDEFETNNEMMPYWSDLWPASEVLCNYLLEHRECFAKKQAKCIEIGAGLGLPGILMAKLGFNIEITDAAVDSLKILEIHLRENAPPNPKAANTRKLDFFDLSDETPNRYDLIIGSDILFETRNCAPLAETIAYLLTSQGTALIADPCRPTAITFPECLKKQKLSFEEIRFNNPNVHIYKIKKRTQ